MHAVKQFIQRVIKDARPKENDVSFRVLGRTHIFCGFDWGSDTFIFEKNTLKNIERRAPLLVVKKSDLARGAHGYVLTLTSGNHNVASVPLLTGAFWNLGTVRSQRRSAVITNNFICGNVVNGVIEISQREVHTARIINADQWLQSLGFCLNEIIFADRNLFVLESYRALGQEWRIKPLAWTRAEMIAALNSSRTTIHSPLHYYHSSGGVHFLSYSEFHELIKLIENDRDMFVVALHEMVGVFKGQLHSNMRAVKINNHHEIEIFGLRMGTAETFVIPELETLLTDIEHGSLTAKMIKVRLIEICYIIKQCLESPELADETSNEFIETMYMHLSGEIYQIDAINLSAAFDARRTALPGATFRNSRPDFHPGVDHRTKVLIYNIQQMLSAGEIIEDVNVYELRDRYQKARAEVRTREIVFKTNRRPLRSSMIEKGLAQRKVGYGDYLLARVHAFRALGVDIGEYRLLNRLDSKGVHHMKYFLRQRCAGEPLDIICPEDSSQRLRGSFVKNYGQESNFILALISLLGNAAAQNIVMKKYIPASDSCRFGEGKEIFEIGYDVKSGRELPVKVMICSLRGVLGWPDTNFTEDNMAAVYDFYLDQFAQVLVSFVTEYRDIVSFSECADLFFSGFECKSREMYWRYASNRDAFDNFNPRLPGTFSFSRRWNFVLWSLEQQRDDLEMMRKLFISKVTESFKKSKERNARKI